MASKRTSLHCGHHPMVVVALQACLWLLVFNHNVDSVVAATGHLPALNGDTIEWGELPPIPTAVNETTQGGSRPATLALMAEEFVKLVQPSGLPLSYFKFALENTVYNNTNYYEDNWQTEMWTIMGLFVGIVVCLLFGILYFLIVPCTGLFFSCCRCCDRCGGKRVQRESKHMGCKRVTLSLFFFSFTGVICAGMAFMNVSNEFIKSSTLVIEETALNTLGDLEGYVNGANEQIDYMVNDEYGFLDQLIRDNLVEIGTEIGDPFEEYLMTEAGLGEVTNSINNISNTFAEMGATLEDIDALQAMLVNQSKLLESDLSDVADALTAINANCSDCIPNVDQLTMTANYSQLPTVDVQIAGVQEANDVIVNITQEIDAVLADIPVQITDLTQDSVDDALVQLDDAKEQVNSSFQEASKILTDAASVLSDTKSTVEEVWVDVPKYTQYIYYTIIGLTCTVLLIVMFNVIGLTMGTFSYKNVHPMERSRMSNAGGNVLMAGVFFTFLFAPLLMILTCLIFGASSMLTLSCDPLKTYALFEETIDQPNVISEGYYLGETILGNSSIPLTVSGVLTECQNDAGAFTAFKLQTLYDFDAIKEQLDGLSEEMDQIIDEIDPSEITYEFPFTDFVDELNRLLEVTELGSINVTQYQAVLNTSVTSLDLEEYANNLTDIGTMYPPEIKSEIDAQVAALNGISDDLVKPMEDNAMEILQKLDLLMSLEKQLEAQVSQAIVTINETAVSLESNATGQAVVNISQEYVDKVVDFGYQFYYQIEDQVENDFAKCKLVSSVYAYAVDSSCDYPISSVNTFWFTLGWCVFFYVPSLILAVKLAKYYRIMDEEAPYRAPKSKSKKKKQNRTDSDEEMPMDSMDAGTDNIRLVDNGRPSSMMPQQNPHYVQDEPILAYNDLGRPMAPPPAYNPGGYPQGAPSSLPPVEMPGMAPPPGYTPTPRPSSGYYQDVPLRVNVTSPPPGSSGGGGGGGGNRNSVNMYQYNPGYGNNYY